MIVPVADRLKKVEEYYFSKKLEQISKMRANGLEVINLGIGSPDMVPPESALKATVDQVMKPTNHGYATYRSSPELRSALASWIKKTYEVTVNPDNEVLPLLGSKEGILYLSMALLNPGDTVLIPNPGYPAYASVANLLGAKIVYYDLTYENNWLPNLEALEKEDLTNCKLMWVNYPHMPSGTSASKEVFKNLVAFAKKKKILVCNDNPYGLVLNKTKPLSIIEADPHMEVSAELNSLSKSFNMAGWRVGCFLGSKELVNAVISVKSNVDSGMFLPIQMGAVAALKVEDSWHNTRNEIYEKRRKLVWDIFDMLGFTYSRDQVGLFVWAKSPDSINDVTTHIDHILESAHVFLTPGMIFGSNGNRFARASLCTSEENLIKAKEKIREFLK
ncbi:MAG: aminotransferase class I/II-fold pyridoxal phosphate-dependent enzyme [Bdellovibrionales bacterium]|nr:aminotransferase class I/II-fold pyridoxal phosphate-dependent enzyme [Bdellovibrionales bacterium]